MTNSQPTVHDPWSSPFFGWTLRDLSHFSSLSHVKHKARNEMSLSYGLLSKALNGSTHLSFPPLFSSSTHHDFCNFYENFLMSKMIWKKFFSVFISVKQEATLLYKVLHMENIYTNIQNFKKLNCSLFP